VVRNGILVEPENPEALAEGIIRLYRDPDLRRSLASSGLHDVESYAMRRVAEQFLTEVEKVAPGVTANQACGAGHAR
jgi:colanic acid biosynthesis glycosyl transferase WcaI